MERRIDPEIFEQVEHYLIGGKKVAILEKNNQSAEKVSKAISDALKEILEAIFYSVGNDNFNQMLEGF